MVRPIISADSHVCEHPNTFIDRIDKRFRDTAPSIVHDPKRGDVFKIEGAASPIRLSLTSAAGKKPEELSPWGAVWEKLHKGGWDPAARIVDQTADGIAAEVIYPSVGMEVCNVPDMAYKKACMDAYNLWIAEFCDHDPLRLIGLGQTPMRTPEEGIADLRKIKELGLRGVMLPGWPGQEDYHSEIYDEFWEASIELGLPISFHILTSGEGAQRKFRGETRFGSFMNIIRANQDIMSMFVFDGVFMRHPKLKVVCVEADAGWAAHYMYRMDHAYKRHRFWSRGKELEKLPSDYFREHIYLTFQDDYTAFENLKRMNIERLCWANDYPHSDSTWPHSQEVLKEQTAGLTDAQKDLVLHDNIAALYNVNLSELAAAVN